KKKAGGAKPFVAPPAAFYPGSLALRPWCAALAPSRGARATPRTAAPAPSVETAAREPDVGFTRQRAQETHNGPPLLVGERLLERRHGGARDALGDKPVQLAVGVPRRHQRQPGRRRPHFVPQRPVAPAFRAVADGAIGHVQLPAQGDNLLR